MHFKIVKGFKIENEIHNRKCNLNCNSYSRFWRLNGSNLSFYIEIDNLYLKNKIGAKIAFKCVYLTFYGSNPAAD